MVARWLRLAIEAERFRSGKNVAPPFHFIGELWMPSPKSHGGLEM